MNKVQKKKLCEICQFGAKKKPGGRYCFTLDVVINQANSCRSFVAKKK